MPSKKANTRKTSIKDPLQQQQQQQEKQKQQQQKKQQQNPPPTLATQQQNISSQEDEFDHFGKNVAMKLRNMPHRARIIAEKLLGDVLFRAQLGILEVDTKISTDETGTANNE